MMGQERWLITGGCGFIGSNLVRELLADEGKRIRILDNESVGSIEDVTLLGGMDRGIIDCRPATQVKSWPGKDEIQCLLGDIVDREACYAAARDADIIIHLAANTGVAPSVENPLKDCESNVVGTVNMLEAARAHGSRRFVFASSGAPVGAVKPPITEEVVPHPVSPYGASKLAGEGYCSAYQQTFGIETVVLRFSNVYGPGSQHKESVVAKFIKETLSGSSLEIYGDGSQTRDFLFVADLVRAIQRAASVQGIGGEIFQISTGIETSIGELVQEMQAACKEAGLPPPTHHLAPPRQGDVLRNFAANQKAKKLLGWSPTMSLVEGLAETIRWLKPPM